MRNPVKILVAVLAVVLVSCSHNRYSIYQFDNGDDYLCEGLMRVVDKDGKIGFSDSSGHIVITPQFAFAFPFENGVSKATMRGHSEPDGEYKRWVSDEWFYIDHSGHRVDGSIQTLEQKLRNYVNGKDARIGVAVIIDGKDTVSVNGTRDYPMLSVYKFPQALAVAAYCKENNVAFTDTISISKDEIKRDTWSPLREKYGVKDIRLPISELLSYSVQQSDNNACDVLFGLIGGPEVADSIVRSLGVDGIVIGSTEDEMHRDIYLCYQNRATPIAMACLLDMFDMKMRGESAEYEEIASLMENCTTGADRLSFPLKGTGAVCGHKTGTGDVNSQGRIIGVNDAGYVHLPDGRHYSIAVFVADSAYGMDDSSAIIAEISRIVYDFINELK